jgi:molecular chaperone HscB
LLYNLTLIDHFQTFGIPRTLTALPAVLERRFHELQRSYHPDKHVSAEDAAKTEALDKSSSINQAYRVLRDPHQRMKHLLAIHGMSVDSQKQVPNNLLMTVMEVQEKLAELEFSKDPRTVAKVNRDLAPFADQFEEMSEIVDTKLETLAVQWDKGNGPMSEPGNLEAEDKQRLEDITKLLAERAYLHTLRLSIGAAQRGEPAMIRH